MSIPSTPRVSAPGTPRIEAIHLPTEIPLPDSQASTEAVRAWIHAWHISHGVSIDAYTLSQITWTGRWIHEQPPAQLESEIFSWGVSQERGRMMVLDLVRERRGQIDMKQLFFGGDCHLRGYLHQLRKMKLRHITQLLYPGS
ncbi:hypothetical protein N431DRAFT_505659 [Stipitochalara longipes BDJ]|nr:hypothetical protein N431DRAFT_505659 [Stipitochalara longipes BDJ]